jgi:hypothetical protein
MSAVSRGLNAERRVAIFLRDLGYLVSSRRHIGGAGDLLCIDPFEGYWPQAPLLVEVKSDKAGPFATFLPTDREAMSDVALVYGCEPLLCWWPTPTVGPFWIPADEWPQVLATNATEEEAA